MPSSVRDAQLAVRRSTLARNVVVGSTAGVGLIAALLFTGGAAAPLIADPGPFTRWGLPLVRVVHDLAASITVGLLVVAATILPTAGTSAGKTVPRRHQSGQVDQSGSGQRSARIGGVSLRAVRLAGVAGAVWVSAAVIVIVLTYARVSGVGPRTPGFAEQLGRFLVDLVLLWQLLISALVVTVVATLAGVALRQATVGWLAILSLVALVPIALTGHTAGSANHEVAVDSLVGHLVGVAVWFGALMALSVLRHDLGPGLATVVRRYSTLALWCFGIVAVSGSVNSWLRLGGWAGFGSRYGVLVLIKMAALVLLGFAGWWHRSRMIAQLEKAAKASSSAGRGVAAPFWRLIFGELLVMAVAIGVAVALANSVGPVREQVEIDPALALTGYPLPPPLVAQSWVTMWRIDLLWTTLAVLGITLYLAGAARLARRGDHWPLRRTVPFILGWAIMIWATSGAPGVYGRVLFSAHMIGHMTVAMIVPALLVLGAPVTLAMRALTARTDGSTGPREWLLAVVHSRFLAVLGHPLVAAGLFVSSLVIFYYTSLFELSLRTHTGHVLMHVHFLLAGYVFVSIMIGVDPGPTRPPYPLRLVLLFATMAFHAFFGVALVSGTELLAADVLGSLGRTWGRSPITDQQYGGLAAWGLGELPVLLLAVGIAVAWSRSDDRQARRSDRQADRDGGAELAAYNARLGWLAGQNDAQNPARSDTESSNSRVNVVGGPEDERTAR